MKAIHTEFQHKDQLKDLLIHQLNAKQFLELKKYNLRLITDLIGYYPLTTYLKNGTIQKTRTETRVGCLIYAHWMIEVEAEYIQK